MLKIYTTLSNVKRLFKILPLLDVIKFMFISYLFNKNKIIELKPRQVEYPIRIRNNGVDIRTFIDSFQHQYHLPPIQLKFSDDPIILDLGANIGLTCCHLKKLVPNATVIGYELDTDNAELAAINVGFYKDVTIINLGVWAENISSTYSTSNNTDAYKIEKLAVNDTDVREVNLKSMTELVHDLEKIDFLKMDIEGAEIEIFSQSDLSWLNKINGINIEFHLDETQNINDYKDIFIKNGFEICAENKHWSSITGYRRL